MSEGVSGADKIWAVSQARCRVRKMYDLGLPNHPLAEKRQYRARRERRALAPMMSSADTKSGLIRVRSGSRLIHSRFDLWD